MKYNGLQSAIRVEQTIKEIRDRYDVKLNNKERSKLIADVCAKYEINESHIRHVAGFAEK